ncbi:alpha/beta fold hydrolase [Citricoccus sp. NR2]|uniref:alpha/beta fold hydrolase n=1 Tax=Citricoccus sp. NR2 TaxID=3004095 RepID=UPI0022DDCC69|nr:alpha/beta hydrolase [Citricoccus sp. NR2]WBL19602.1 alpha/beta hydrolase [Citricoccus sp. NR2]
MAEQSVISARTWMISGTAGTIAEFDALAAAWPEAAHRWALPEVESVAEAARLLVIDIDDADGDSAPELLIGHSAGGIVAAHAALTLAGGDALRTGSTATEVKLVLLDSNMPAEPDLVRAKQRRFHTGSGPRTPSSQEFLDSMSASIGAAPDEVRHQIMERMRAAADTEARTRFWPDVLAEDTAALWDQLAAAGIPVLYLQATRPVDAAAVTVLHPSAVVRSVPEAGHWVHVTHPQEVTRLITGWRG